MNGRKENAGWALAKLHCLAVTPKFFMTERCGSAVTPLRARSIHPFRQQSDGEKTHSHVNFTQKVFPFLQKHLSLQRSFNATRLSFRPISDSGERLLKTNLIQYIYVRQKIYTSENHLACRERDIRLWQQFGRCPRRRCSVGGPCVVWCRVGQGRRSLRTLLRHTDHAGWGGNHPPLCR